MKKLVCILLSIIISIFVFSQNSTFTVKSTNLEEATKEAIRLFESKEYTQSLNIAVKIIEISQSNYLPYYIAGRSLFSMKRYDDACKYLEKAEKMKSFFDTTFYLGSLYAEMEMYGKAITMLEKSLYYERYSDKAFEQLGLIYINLEDYESAVPLLESAVDINNNLYYRYNLGYAYYKNYETENAEREINRSIDLFNREGNGDLEFKKRLDNALNSIRSGKEFLY